MILFHVSIKVNRRSIQREGVSPDYSTCHHQRIWLVDERRVMWALAHVSLRHKVPVSDLIICVSSVDDTLVSRTRWIGVYTATRAIKVSQFQHPKRFMEVYQMRWAQM